MPDEASIEYQPDDVRTAAALGETILHRAGKAGVGIESLCGGQGLCGTCEVIVTEGIEHLEPPTEAERAILSEEQLAAGHRLSCRATLAASGEVDISVPAASQLTSGIVLTEGNELEVTLDPAVKHHRLVLEPPTLEDNLADRERVIRALADEYDLDIDDLDHRVQRDLPRTLRASAVGDHLEVTATVYRECEVIGVHPGSVPPSFGLAVDIGTTTVAAYLVDLDTGEVEAVSAQLNPQRFAGEDIMSRMRYVRRNEDGLAVLQSAIVEGINDAIDEVTSQAGVATDDVYEASFVGNTAMHHLFLGYDPNAVAGSPYIPARHEAVTLKARELGIDINPAGYVYWLPVSGGWVGPDKVAVLLASGHYAEEPLTVCIDIGTNGEISVGNVEQTWTTSAPAGPALEGAELTHGVRAQAGAIDHVTIDPEDLEPGVETIDDAPPIGLCGSGVIDALAQLFLVGIVDRRGTFALADDEHRRLRTDVEGVREFVLVDADDAGTDGDIVITQNDIRDVQMAKAAIQAGTLVLMETLDIETVDRLVIAGAFGNYIDAESAMLIGLYPDLPLEAVTSLGNGAGVGAQLALLDTEARAEARRIVDRVDYFEIAGTDAFQAHFLQSMYLPHQVFERYPRVREQIEAIRSPIDVEQPLGDG